MVPWLRSVVAGSVLLCIENAEEILHSDLAEVRSIVACVLWAPASPRNKPADVALSIPAHASTWQ